MCRLQLCGWVAGIGNLTASACIPVEDALAVRLVRGHAWVQQGGVIAAPSISAALCYLDAWALGALSRPTCRLRDPTLELRGLPQGGGLQRSVQGMA